ncbi:tetraacyldisaccharide 4'-kinase [Aquirufa regiilacus]|uniref:Tetraacyldisaccharide 4'-kinase n=1 Tax=Aquirufa regiilacus TaxID=3024868 RepID=A0ABU3TRF5_9BACT|nr:MULTISPECIES: tetraacyldisaccharide 4'-kinase [unclassified Aquirufa]MDT8886631.1 tetraacyldisaccharide 4'-kinase [Aquirufa sp. LEPPI-3A]MDU0808404.1 tetraacyldisaccharide 4'-kinase [Aquirufa sp. LEOWEIH-7C]
MIKRLLFYVLSELYGLITSCRNALYDRNVFSSKHFNRPTTLVIGNLAVGGTGKSPFVAYLVQHWPFPERLGILSRGYGRKTKGFRMVESTSKASEVGDEPLAYKRQMPEITVAVCEKRVIGVEKLQNEVDTLFLDDAFQHRAIQGDLNLLCTTYDKPFFIDKMLPLGRLRESSEGVKRAQAIVVNRCPATMTDAKKSAFESYGLPVFYTRVRYGSPVGPALNEIKNWHLVAGIADPLPFFKQAKSLGDIINQESYEDHYAFQTADFQYWEYIAKQCQADTGILTTHKDFMRFQEHLADYPNLLNHLYYLPMQMEFVSEEAEFWTWMKQSLKR